MQVNNIATFRSFVRAAALVVAVLSCFSARGQVAGAAGEAQESLWAVAHHVDSVVVLGRRPREIAPAQVMGGEQLERLSTSSVADAVRHFTGVQIKDYGGIGGLKTINVRSLGSAHTGVFYDGVQVSSAQNGTVDLGRFSLDGVASIALYNGQKSDIFQPARDFASSSALYITARRPEFAPGRKSNLRTTIKTGSFDLLTGSAIWERRLSPGLSASVQTEALTTSGRYRYRYTGPAWDTTAVRRNGDVTSIRTEASLFGLLRGGEWRVKGYFYGSGRGYPGAVIKQDAAIALRNEDRQTDRQTFIQASAEQRLTDAYSYRVQAKYALDRMRYVMPPQTTLQPQDTRYRAREAYISLSNLFEITRAISASVALDGQYNRLEARDDVSALFNHNFSHPRRLTILSAAAISARTTRLSAQGSVLHTFTRDWSSTSGPRNRSIFTPSVVASWRPIEALEVLEVRAFYKRIFRLPTFNDLYYTQLGSRQLRPEFTTQYNLGMVWRITHESGPLQNLELSADAYYNQVRDKIIATPTSNQLVWTMVNLGFVRIRGLDIAAAPTLRLGSKTILDARLTYTYQRAQDFSPERKPHPDTPPTVRSNYGDQIPYIPRHSGSAIVGVTWRQWSASYSAIFTGPRWGLGDNVPSNRLAAWQTHDISLSREIPLRSATIRLAAEVNNLLGQRYEVVRWYPMPGTNVKLTISVTL